jgi:ribosomal protein S19
MRKRELKSMPGKGKLLKKPVAAAHFKQRTQATIRTHKRRDCIE